MNRRDFSDLIELGRGAQSIVYRARQHAMGRTVVLKRMRAENREQRQAAIAHVKALSSSSIPASAAIYGLFVHKRDVWIVEEYIEGITLAEARLESWPPALRLYQAGLLVAALGRVHNAGWAHGDIKPSNILLTVRGDVRFLDFGLARPIDGGGMADDQPFFRAGTLDYLVPEASLPHPYDCRKADIYAAALSIEKLLSPGMRDASSAAMNDTERAVADIVIAARSMQPEKRPESAYAMAKPFYDSAASLGVRGERADRELAAEVGRQWRAIASQRYLAAVDAFSAKDPAGAYRILCELIEIEPDSSDAVVRLEHFPAISVSRRDRVRIAIGASAAALIAALALVQVSFSLAGAPPAPAPVAPDGERHLLLDTELSGGPAESGDTPLLEEPGEAPVEGTIRLKNIPEGARILVDRAERRAEGPRAALRLAPGDHLIQVARDSSIHWEKTVRVFPLSDVDIAVD